MWETVGWNVPQTAMTRLSSQEAIAKNNQEKNVRWAKDYEL